MPPVLRDPVPGDLPDFNLWPGFAVEASPLGELRPVPGPPAGSGMRG